MPANRRSLILGATLGMIAPKLVRAESLIDVPGDPLTKHGLHAATQWASEEFSEKPGCRLVFASGHYHRWMTWPATRQGADGHKDVAVAIEVAVTDKEGRRFVHSIPFEAEGMEKVAARRREQMMRKYEQMRIDWEMS